MSKENGWRVNQATFQGYVKATLENIQGSMKEVVKQTDKNTKDIATAKGLAKGAMIVGGIGAGGGLLSFFKGLFK